MEITRRSLLKGAAGSFAVVAAGAAVPPVFARAAWASGLEREHGAPASRDRVLVVIQLAGGNDGLNTVVPVTNPVYYQKRPTLAVQPPDTLPLSPDHGLNPLLAPLHPLFVAGKLAIVDGVGYPEPNRSHFRAMEIWQGADPKGLPPDGWLGRYLDRIQAQGVLEGVVIGQNLPRELFAREPVPVVADPANYRVVVPNTAAGRSRSDAMLQMYGAYAATRTAPYAALLDQTVKEAMVTSDAIVRAVTGYQPAVEYPNSPLANGLRALAAIIDAGIGARVGHVRLGGFDTHANQGPVHARLLTSLGAAMAAFQADIEAHGHGDRVVTMTWSEFGRRLGENGNAGTDHGAPGPMFILGQPVRGGLYGHPMDLTVLENGDPLHTIDYRSVYTTVLDRWFQADARGILGAPWPLVPFL